MEKTVERKKRKMTKIVEPIKRFTRTVEPKVKKKKILDLTPTSKRN